MKNEKRILFTAFNCSLYSGSQMHVYELGEYFAKNGWRVAIASVKVSDALRRSALALGIELYEADRFPENTQWDLGMCYHYPLLPLLLDRGVQIDKVLFGSLSVTEILESPPPAKGPVRILGHSLEWKERFSELYGIAPDRLEIMPNLAPDAFYDLYPLKTYEQPKRIAVISNHVPDELRRAAELFGHKGVETVFLGCFDSQEMITPDLLRSQLFDCVITIGKTVQYCLAAGIPVYCYDHYGGTGYISMDNVDTEAEFNFSGRATGRKLFASEIVCEIGSGYASALAQLEPLRAYADRHFRLSVWVERILADDALWSPTEMQALTVRQLSYITKLYMDSSRNGENWQETAEARLRENEALVGQNELARQEIDAGLRTIHAMEDYLREKDAYVVRLQQDIAADRAGFEETLSSLSAAKEAVERTLNEQLTLLGEKDALLAEKDALLTGKDALLSEKDSLLTEKDALLAEKDAELSALREMVSSLNIQLQDKTEQIRERDARISELNETCGELNTLYQNILNSRIWKLTAPIRKILDLFKRH